MPNPGQSRESTTIVRAITSEVFLWVMGVLALVALMQSALVIGTMTFRHDNLYWGYPNYHLWAESLMQGRLPLWNPFSHGGEPFYPLLMQSRLLDPNSLLVLAAGSLFTEDLILLYNWDRFVRGLLIAVGSYLLLRRWAEHHITRLSLIPVLLFSSFHLAGYHSNGIADQFLWAPWMLLVLCRILEDGDSRWSHWIMLGVLLGFNWQSYFFSGVWTLLLVFLIGVALFRRDLLRVIAGTPRMWLKAGMAALIVVLMCLPNAELFFEKDRYIFPLRMIDSEAIEKGHRGGPFGYEPGANSPNIDSIAMPYSMVAVTGSFSTMWNFVQLIVPFGNKWVAPNVGWGHASESVMYFGVLVYAGAMYGLVAGRHGLKWVWFLIWSTFGLLMLGPLGGLHRILFIFYPPLWFMRHTLVLALFFSLAMLYFYVIGCNRILAPDGPLRSRLSGKPWTQVDREKLLLALIVGAILVGAGIGAAWVKYPDDWLTAPLILLSGCDEMME